MGTCDPYLFKSLKVKLLRVSDVHVHLVENCSPHTAARMKAGRVNNTTVWEAKNNKLFTVKAKISATASLNKVPHVNLTFG